MGADPTDIGNALADIHHILVTQDGNDKKTARLDPPNFAVGDNTLDLTMAVGEMTTLVPKAATQSKQPILGVVFEWSTDSDDIMVNGYSIKALEPTNSSGATLTLTAMSRGVSVDFTVNVLSVIERIEFATGQATSYTLPVSGTIELMTPVAYDAAEGGNLIEGAEELISWVSNKPDVVSVDGNTIKAESEGTAEITAQGQGKTSKAKITVTVVDIAGTITHVMRANASSEASRTRAVTVAADTTGDGNVDVNFSNSADGEDSDPVTITFTVLAVDHAGETSPNTDALTATVRSQNPDVIANQESGGVTVTISGADGTVTVPSNAETMVGYGNAYLVVTLPGAADLPLLPVIIKVPATE